MDPGFALEKMDPDPDQGLDHEHFPKIYCKKFKNFQIT